MAETPSHFYNQSAVLPYRILGNRIEFLLVTSRGRKRWVLPKGVIDPGLTAVQSAVKEAWEEAGIEGTVSRLALGSYSYAKWGGLCTVEVFAFAVDRVAEIWPESYRGRQWFKPREAAQKVDEPELREIIARSADRLSHQELD